MEETKAPEQQPSEDWAGLPWRKLEQYVYRLQKRIYKASSRGNVQAVHRLQQLLMKSEAARLLAVRRVTQDNQGKKTAGVDGKLVLTGKERLTLAKGIHPKQGRQWKPAPTRRVWIPKPGKTEKRPLGIPTIQDRACQALAKLALEPEWEAKFEPNSYGFRPGRSCHDAIAAVYINIGRKAKYVLDADIAGCFDHISHQALLAKLGTYPAMKRAIKAWLKAGVMEGMEFQPTTQGTPQGGVLSPLLANIALHGMETTLLAAYREKDKPQFIRYADDFVVFHHTEIGILKAQQLLIAWLADMGLELKPSKTRITHTLNSYQGNKGFDFLGFSVQQIPVGKRHARRSTNGTPLGYRTLITPSKEVVKRHLQALSAIVRTNKAAPQEGLIAQLNPVIRGWANYYRTVASTKTYAMCGLRLYSMLRSWARSRHPNKSAHWIAKKYWAVGKGQGWKFNAPDGSKLFYHYATPMKHYVKVKGSVSPYDGNLTYWVQRLKEHPLLHGEKARLLMMQQGKCSLCGLTFRDDDLLETDHIVPRKLGGTESIWNKMVCHRHCHDVKSAQEVSSESQMGRGVQ
jgi:RNA-directed DNA polymerase